MKCQSCAKNATLHITEVLGDGYEEFHFCEECAHGFLTDSQAKKEAAKASKSDKGSGDGERRCEVCGLKFSEFRNSGRLGCPHDYSAFQSELAPLLEGIHGQNRHQGKTPLRLPQTRQIQLELGQLRKQLARLVSEENYEAAAGVRDRIRELEVEA